MAAVIYNNLSATKIQNICNTNSRLRTRAAQQLYTGEKFNAAGTGQASEYNISEKMRVMIRGLDQCAVNTKTGRNLLKIASGAVESQVEIMRKIRELAMRSSDDTYTNGDRKYLQQEVEFLLDQTEELAQSTNFNGQYLLNGTTLTKAISGFDPTAGDFDNPGDVPIIMEALANPDKKYDLAQKSYTDNLSGYYAKGAALSGIPTAVGGKIIDGANKIWTVELQGGAYGYKDGAGVFQQITAGNYNTFFQAENAASATTAVGDTVWSSTGEAKTLVKSPITGNLAVETTSGYYYVMDFSNLNGYDLPVSLDDLGFSVKCLDCNQHMSFRFSASSDQSSFDDGGGGNATMLYTIGIKNVRTVDELVATVFNGVKNAKNPDAGPTSSTFPTSNDSVQIASHHNVMMHYNADTKRIVITKDSNRTQMYNGVVGKATMETACIPEQILKIQTGTKSGQSVNLHMPNTSLSALFPSVTSKWDIDPKETDYPENWPNEYSWNYEKNRAMTEAEKKEKWRDEVWKYPSKKVVYDNDVSVITRDKANAFIDLVDQAIKYLLAADTTLGGQSNRLESTEANLIVASENVMASESVIRDTNMSKAVTDETKYNLLLQVSQSMLAQANQAQQNVLALLQ